MRLVELLLVERVQLDGFEQVQLEARLESPHLRRTGVRTFLLVVVLWAALRRPCVLATFVVALLT